ncbi:unnamed protein product [Caenorhabditis bovis]|uniref:Uncharacterized protein n=1 Tax=Caenorhabditis bovis TaxID=2654633 RepID=A0A8S1EHS2_9PELO|nr:unnamed protein product [Caenorhabditis bovis]
MEGIDFITLSVCLLAISVYGLLKSKQTVNEERTARSAMVGSGASVWSVTLSVCSGFISSISLLGFPAEVYYQGGMMLWFAPMYVIAFPLVAYVFLPVIYNLRLTTLYEYFERRFNYNCRFATTTLFCIQMILYNSVALYAPSLAISSITKIPILLSIFITAFLSATYICVGGAKAAIHTSALQMALIFVTMTFIIMASLNETTPFEVYKNVVQGNRLILNDFRVNPTIRHSVWSLMIGGMGNVVSLFAANQLSMQRYLGMDSLKSAQKVALLNIVCNTLILFSYVSVGFLIYSYYKDCHPNITNANELLPQYVTDVLSKYPGAVGLFAAAVYSAGISTLSASFNAVSSILINDVWKHFRLRKNMGEMSHEHVQKAMRFTPGICSQLQSIVLQLSFIVFGAGGGPVLGSFVVGLFCPVVKGRAAFIGFVFAVIACFTVSIGSAILKVKPYPLELGSCGDPSNSTFNIDNLGRITSTPLMFGLDRIFAISYQYYSVIGVVTNVLISIAAQKFYAQTSQIMGELVQRILTTSHFRPSVITINTAAKMKRLQRLKRQYSTMEQVEVDDKNDGTPQESHAKPRIDNDDHLFKYPGNLRGVKKRRKLVEKTTVIAKNPNCVTKNEESAKNEKNENTAKSMQNSSES